MKEADRLRRNSDMIAQLYDPMRQPVRGLLADLSSMGFRPRIQQSYRSAQEQSELAAKGLSQRNFGFHNFDIEGVPAALAVDLVDDDDPIWPNDWQARASEERDRRRRFVLCAAIYARRYGLSTGIGWGLEEKARAFLLDCVAAGMIRTDLAVGWDPLHVEPAGITVHEVRDGKWPTFNAAGGS